MDIESLLRPVSASSPCGIDLEYDPEFLDLDRLVQGKPEQQMGKTVVRAQEPDWDVIQKRSTALLSKTKDLRIAVILARALLHAEGWVGLRDGLAVLRGLVERYWDGIFPRLDHDDQNDPTFRINILMGLCDPAVVLDRVRCLPLVISRSFGRFSLRDLAVASGELPPALGAKPPAAAAIDGAFAESAISDLQTTAANVRASLDHLAAIETTIGAHMGVDRGPSFAKFSGLLQQADKILAARLAQRGPAPAAPVDGSPGDAKTDKPSSLPPAAPLGTAASREDVVRFLDRICEYYQRHEPSSPLPLLLQRCKRLVSASFMDIIRDLAPGAVSQVEILRGKDGEKASPAERSS